MVKDLNLGWEIDMTISMLGIDIAKNTFQITALIILARRFTKRACLDANWPLM